MWHVWSFDWDIEVIKEHLNTEIQQKTYTETMRQFTEKQIKYIEKKWQTAFEKVMLFNYMPRYEDIYKEKCESVTDRYR